MMLYILVWWYLIGLVLSFIIAYNAWKNGEDIFVLGVFVAALAGVILMIPITVEYHSRIANFFTIRGRKK